MAFFPDTSSLVVLDYAGTAVFAATGALAAARRGQTIVTFAFFAAVTGVGGGTLRDLLLGAPVFWVNEPHYIAICIAVAGLIWSQGARRLGQNVLLWLDAVGLAAYAVAGAAKAADYGAPPLVSIAMGVLSASFGGIVRDVLAGRPSVVLSREIYISAAVLGAGLFVLFRLMGAGPVYAGLIGAAAAFALRAGALGLGWSLPGYSGPDLDSAPIERGTAADEGSPPPAA